MELLFRADINIEQHNAGQEITYESQTCLPFTAVDTHFQDRPLHLPHQIPA